MPIQREYLIKVFGPDGTTPKATINKANLKGKPAFRGRINGAQGECVLDLVGSAYKFDAYSEGTVVKHMNVVEIHVVDRTHMLGRRVYKGFISRYAPYIKDTGEEGVSVTCLGLGSLLSRSYFGGFSLTGAIYTTQDPTVIAKAIIDGFNGVYGGNLITYDSSSIPATVGATVTYTYKDQKWLDALNTTVALAGTNWWWFVDQDGKLQFKAKPSSATWTFTVGLEISSITATKDAEKVVNDLTVRYAGNAHNEYQDTTSQATFGTGNPQTGKSSLIISDTSIADSGSADARGNKAIGDLKNSLISAVVTLNPQADLEGIRMGDTLQIVNRNKNDTTFSSNMQIVSMNYDGDSLTVELESINNDLGKALATFVKG